MGESNTAQRANQDVGHRGEPQAQLIGAHRLGRGAVGKQVELALFDAVLHVTAGAVELLVEMPALMLIARQRGDDEAGVGLAAGPLGLCHDPALAAPAVQGPPGEILETPRRPGAHPADLGSACELAFDLANEPAVLGEAEQIILNPAVGGLREARNRRKPPRWGQKRRVWWFTPRVSNLRLKRGRRSPTLTPVGFTWSGTRRRR